MMLQKIDTLVICSGANSELAKPFLDYFVAQKRTEILAIFNATPIKATANIIPLHINLLNTENTQQTINNILQKKDYTEVKKIFLLHFIGSFIYEGIHNTLLYDYDNDGIDDQVFQSNINTFKNVISPLETYLKDNKNITMTLFNVGSKRDYDPANVPRPSYAKTKNILRTKFQELCNTSNKIAALFVNAGTIDIQKERILRPYGEYHYRLSPQEVFEGSIKKLVNIQAKQYDEIELYKFHPDYETLFKSENIYQTHKRWLKEMGIQY